MSVQCLSGNVSCDKHYLVIVPSQFKELFSKYDNQLIKVEDLDYENNAVLVGVNKTSLPAQWLREVKLDFFNNTCLTKFANRALAEIEAYESSNAAVLIEEDEEDSVSTILLTIIASVLILFMLAGFLTYQAFSNERTTKNCGNFIERLYWK